VTSEIKKSQAQERRGAKLFGGRVLPGSGSRWFAKGDVSTDRFLIEYKRTDRASFSITLETWQKIRREAALEGKTPLLGVNIGGELGRNIVVLDEDDFLEMLNGSDTQDPRS
jgi:hypothetical protein